jgi:Ser/Thr protein kinase RdoA (MazF antagonist)
LREALAVARCWDADATGLVHLRTGENSVWRATLAGKPFVLRITAEPHRSSAQLEAELAFVNHLQAGGLAVARPQSMAGGAYVLDTSALVATQERTHATVFSWLAGRHFSYHSPDVDRPLFHLWGETMARLHQLSRAFEPGAAPRRPDWPDDRLAGCSLDGVVLDSETVRLRDELVGRIRRLTPEPTHYGMVHGDFERGNFVLDSGSIGLFDFDDCCRHWFFWDIACALWVFRNATAEERARILGWFLEGYAVVREPDARCIDHWSELIRLRTLALLLRRLRQPAGLMGRTDRMWVARTRAWLQSGWSW